MLISEIRKIPIKVTGLLIICISLNFFLLPHEIASAGVGAVGFLVQVLWGVDLHLTVWIINVSMLILTLFLLGKATFFRILLGSLLFPLFLSILPEMKLLDSYPLSLILGSFCFSFGVYFLIKIDSSNGGLNVPPLFFKKYFNLDESLGMFISNLVILLLNFIVQGLEKAFIASISIVLMSLFMKLLLKLPIHFIK
ncbi:MAG: YitT family protein [Streptococcaceae bacterium]|nr:YitT family protein [Streptococcaceae bacterium]MCL2681296.1 YitT family protein [Streptococcaceae bacterium]MCL2858287.1 YitT family protein [Streptococcaceae bacterium]